MKGSHLAALVTGWLAVAMAAAAIGSASVARVGLGIARPQSQITVSRAAAPIQAFPTGGTAADFVESDVAPARAEGRTLTVTPYPTPSARTTALPVQLPTTAPPTTTASTDPPVILAPPSSGSGDGPTLGLLPTTSPSSTSPGKGSTKKGTGRTSPTPVPSTLLTSPATIGGASGVA